MIYPDHLLEYVIRPVLESMRKWSMSAGQLLLLTAAQESLGGRYLHQLGGGPAVGIFQMEPATHDDIWKNYLKYREELSDQMLAWATHSKLHDHYGPPKAKQMAGNLYYAAAMARVHYLRVPHPLPQAGDVAGLARYYKDHYNTAEGAASVDEAARRYREYVNDNEIC